MRLCALRARVPVCPAHQFIEDAHRNADVASVAAYRKRRAELSAAPAAGAGDGGSAHGAPPAGDSVVSSVQAWAAGSVPPRAHPVSGEAPEEALRLEWVYGYRAQVRRRPPPPPHTHTHNCASLLQVLKTARTAPPNVCVWECTKVCICVLCASVLCVCLFVRALAVDRTRGTTWGTALPAPCYSPLPRSLWCSRATLRAG